MHVFTIVSLAVKLFASTHPKFMKYYKYLQRKTSLFFHKGQEIQLGG